MDVLTWAGRRADRPVTAGIAFGAAALCYTAAYVAFVSPHGLFVVPAATLVVSATLGGFLSGYAVWRHPITPAVDRTARGDALSGLLVGWVTLVVAPPLAVLGMTLPSATGYAADISLITPILIAGYLLNAVAWGFLGTIVATVATLGTPLVVTTAVGVALGSLRRRSGAIPVGQADGSGG